MSVESQIYNKSIDFYSRMMESVDDIVVALLKALQKKADKESEKVIQDFLKYVENGGKLKSIEINNDALEVLTNRMKEQDLSFLCTSDSQDDSMKIVHFKDKDAEKVADILNSLSIEGVKLQNTNRLDLQELVKKQGGKMAQAVFTVDEYRKNHKAIHHILNKDLNIPYAVHHSFDQKFVILSVPSQYIDELKKSVIFKDKIKSLDVKLTMNDVKKNVEEFKKQAEKTNEKQKKNENSR